MAVDQNRHPSPESDTGVSSHTDSVGVIGTYPAVPAAVRDAREAAADMAERHGADRGCVEDIRLAVSEAATNVVMHAYERCDRGSFRVLALVGSEQMVVVLEDDGRGLSAPGENSGLGAGLRVMEQVTEQAMFLERDGGGSTVQLTFRLHH